MLKNKSLSFVIFNSSIVIWIFSSILYLLLSGIMERRYNSIENDFFEFAKQYNLQAYHPDGFITSIESSLLLIWFIGSIITFGLICFSVWKKNRKWVSCFLILHFFAYYGTYWYLIDEVSIEFRSPYFIENLMQFVTGVFFCSALWVVNERIADPTA